MDLSGVPLLPWMILPLALAWILILAVLTAIQSNNHAFAFGNSFTFVSPTSSEESNNTGSTQESSNAGNGQASSNTGNAAQAASNNGNTADLAKTILAVHNRERAAVGVPPLVWNNTLAADAKAWAEYVATLGGKLVHASAEWVAAHPTGPEGENIVSHGPVPFVTPAEMVQDWVKEKKDYHGEPGDFNGVGHYTQMVWNTTKAVGCGTAKGPGGTGDEWTYLVCRYSPPGNIFGQKPY
jgi:pathogenesis-related protein 1